MNIKNVSFLDMFLLWMLTRGNSACLLTSQSTHLQTNLQRKETYAPKLESQYKQSFTVKYENT